MYAGNRFAVLQLPAGNHADWTVYQRETRTGTFEP